MRNADRNILLVGAPLNGAETYQRLLQQDASFSYRIIEEPNNPEVPRLCQALQIDGVLVEFWHWNLDILELLNRFQLQLGATCPPIVLIGNEDLRVAVEAIKAGAADYLVKDQLTPDALCLSLRAAIENAELKRELQQSQVQFQTSIENMLDCFGIFSAIRDEAGQILDFRIDYLNTAACENNQLPREAQIGRGLCEVLPGHRESGLFDEYCQLVESGKPLTKESLIYEDTYDGQRLVRAFDIRASKLYDGFVASWRDVTDRKQIELHLSQTADRLQQQQNRLQQLIDNAPIGIGIGLADGTVQAMNDAMLTLCGYTREELQQQGMNWRECFAAEGEVCLERSLARLQQSGFLPAEEKALRLRDGSWVPIWMSAICWGAGTNEYVAFAVDLTPQKQVEAALRASK